jgi:hypothetical protein
VTFRLDELGRHLCLPFVVSLAVLGACDFRTDKAGPAPDDPTSDFCAGVGVFTDEFDAPEIDAAHWSVDPEGQWTVSDGWLRGNPGNKNRAMWLKEGLPERVRIEFDARGESVHGDLKVEVFGDGKAHESGYILIFGGWKNSLNVIARLDEHGKDRKAEPSAKVEKGKTYSMAVVRTGSHVRWYSDRDSKTLLMEYPDAAPLRGAGHDRFAFNNWDVPVSFDNVRVFDLESCP